MESFMNYDFNINKIVVACFVPTGTGDAIHQDRPSHGLALHTAGDKDYIFASGEKINITGGDIIYLPKNSTYEVSAKNHGDCYAINFDFAEDISFSPFAIKIKNQAEILKHFRHANNLWKMKKNGYILKCKAELYNIIYSMHENYFAQYLPKNKLELITPAVDYIHENYITETISIDFLAQMCNISPEYFRKIFKNFFGSSPLNYINNLKITRAKELLESKMYSVTDAAIQSGYTDISHFSREFKKTTGFCPSAYTKNHSS